MKPPSPASTPLADFSRRSIRCGDGLRQMAGASGHDLPGLRICAEAQHRVQFRATHDWAFPYWSLSAWLKHKVKNAVDFISAFEHFIAERAAHNKADGVICGHIHHAEMRQIGNVLYCNDGDWVESCTALVEDFEGNLSIIHWAEERDTLLNAVEAVEVDAGPPVAAL